MNVARFQRKKTRKTSLRTCPTLITSITSFCTFCQKIRQCRVYVRDRKVDVVGVCGDSYHPCHTSRFLYWFHSLSRAAERSDGKSLAEPKFRRHVRYRPLLLHYHVLRKNTFAGWMADVLTAFSRLARSLERFLFREGWINVAMFRSKLLVSFPRKRIG